MLEEHKGYILEPKDSIDESFDDSSWVWANRILRQDYIKSTRIQYIVDTRKNVFKPSEVQCILKKYTNLRFILNEEKSNDTLKHLTVFLEVCDGKHI